jgi:hypothetical protein
MKVLENLMSGASLLGNTSEATKVEMKNGVVTLKEVVAHTSKKGHNCAKIVFQDDSRPTDNLAGHVEYLSTSEGNRFVKTIQKLVYIVKHSGNEAAKVAFGGLVIPIETVNDQAGVPLTFKTMDELKEIQDSYGADVTYVWNENEAKDRTAIRIKNGDAFIAQFIAIMNQFAGSKYFLEVKQDADRGFQRLVSINAPKL